MLKLSVIVPIYNVELYLRKCVNSLLNQDLSHDVYEIILVDDGSTDKSGVICEEFAAGYENIVVVHCDNRGPGATRNSGIEIAQGKYVQFVDSDDYLESNVLNTLVEKMDSDKLDILRFNYQNVNGRYEVFEPNKVSKPFVDYRDEICDGMTFLTERLGFGCYPWQFVIRRELLEGCVFKEGVYFEDPEWVPRLLLKAIRVTSTDLVAYNYLMRQGSITQSVDEKKKRKLLDDRLSLIGSMKEQSEKVNDKRWFEGMIGQIAIGIISSASEDYYESRKVLINRLKEERIFPLSSYHSTDLAVRKIRLANFSPMLLCMMLHFKNK